MELGSDYAYVGCTGEDEVFNLNDIGQSVQESFESHQPADTKTCLLDILDTAGQEEFSSLREQYMREGNGFLVIYDVTNQQSLKEAETIYKWMKVVRETPGNREKGAHTVLCGNKCDLTESRQITKDEGEKVAKALEIPFIETSAKTGLNIAKAFEMLIRLIPRTSVTYKIVILGGGGVGKSSVTIQYVSNTFLDSYDPTIEDSYRKKITLSGLGSFKPRSKSKKEPTHKYELPPPQRMPESKKKRGSLFSRVKRKLSKKGKKDVEEAIQDITMPDAVTKQETVKIKRTDTNVICVNLGILSQEPVVVTGDPYNCKQCHGVLSKVSVDNGNVHTVNGSTTWICEFCDQRNENLELDENELPSGDSFDFILSPAGSLELDSAEKPLDDEESGMAVYCIDISSSMRTEATIPTSQAMWKKMRDGLDPHSFEQTWRKSRLDCIKEAVLRQMESLHVSNPNKKLALVTFSDDIAVYNCGTERYVVKDQKFLFNDKEELLQKGRRLNEEKQFKTIGDSFSELSKTVERLSSMACTALGPALTFCVGLVSKLPGSEIILCTDGSPNRGVGENPNDNYYGDLGVTAGLNKTVVSILAVEGESIGLNYVGAVVLPTNGMMNVVNPLEIQREVRLMSQNQVIASDVSITILLHTTLTFCDVASTATKSNVLEKEVGNVTKDTDLTFRYALKDGETPLEISHVPFQVQVKYTLNNGMKCMRIITKRVQATTNREESEKAVHVSVMGLATVQSSAALAKEGNTTCARVLLHSAQDLMQRGSVTTAQQEEHFGFALQSREYENQLLPERFGTDLYSNLVSRNWGANLGHYQGPSNLGNVYQMRSNFNTNLRDKYYAYNC